MDFALALAALMQQPSWLHAASVLVAALLASLVALMLYRFDLWGGGDVKLAVALSAFVGLRGWSDMWLAIACLAFIAMAWAKYRKLQEVAFAPVLVGGALYAMWSGSA